MNHIAEFQIQIKRENYNTQMKFLTFFFSLITTKSIRSTISEKRIFILRNNILCNYQKNFSLFNRNIMCQA